MQTQYINEILNIPELQVNQILFVDREELHIEAVPVAYRQCCPICRSAAHVNRKGTNGMRTVRHLPAFEKKSYLHVPANRLYCTFCHAGFA